MLSVERVVFLSLILDLFAFTTPLPLFPRIIEWYTKREAHIPDGFLSRTLAFVAGVRGVLYKPGASSQRWDIVLLGGLMGSLFSGLQWFISPRIGALSDKYGRRNVLLATMVGNILSALVWVQSTTFASYLLSRAIGGLSEGNVQLAIAILSDVTTSANRGKALSNVGIAFAICFIIGPPIGAYFASRPFPMPMGNSGIELNIYATPAMLTVFLLVAETIFLMVALPETRGKVPTPVTNGQANGYANGNSTEHANGTANGPAEKAASPNASTGDVQQRLKTLKALKSIHFWFLGIFSGVEFTLTFLTFDLFDWTNSQNGRLLGFIGIISALLQGGYVRRSTKKIGEGEMARRGVTACVISLALMLTLPLIQVAAAVKVLFLAATCLAFTSATVVHSLTTYASYQCDDGVDGQGTDPALAKGRALGEFRSSGQLGRAIGPLLACASYWMVGPSITYAVGAAAMAVVMMSMKSIVSQKKVKAE